MLLGADDVKKRPLKVIEKFNIGKIPDGPEV